MTKIKKNFEIDMVPVAKGRPRFSKLGHAITPENTRIAENLLGWNARIAMRGDKPLCGPIDVEILFSFTKPSSWSKKKITETVDHVSKPDLDNLIKLVLDALNGIVWADDKQIRSLRAHKQYSDKDHISINVEAVKND